MATKQITKNPMNERTEAENIEKIVVDLGKKGVIPAQIGLILKREHNVPKIKLLGKKITKILDEHKVHYKKDLDMVNDKIARIETHAKANKQDKRATREVTRYIGLKKKLEIYQAKKAK